MLYPLIMTTIILGVITIWLMIHSFHQGKLLRYEQASLHRLDDTLATSPIGFFQLFHEKGGWKSATSRRLCIQLNLVQEHETLEHIAEIFTPDSASRFLAATETLLQEQTPFDLRVETILGHRSYHISGRNLPEKTSAVLWFQDITASQQALLKAQTIREQLLSERDMFLEALNHIPLPLVIADQTTNILFQNLPPDNKMSQALDDWTSLSFNTPDNTYTLMYSQDQTRENRLIAEVAERDRFFLTLIQTLPIPMGLFDAQARLTSWNQSFAKLWHLEASWLKKAQTYESFLDIIQEKNLLPRVTDFGAYKRQQQDLFSNLIDKNEYFIYLSDGRVLMRQMIPTFQGSILFVDSIQTKITKEG